MEAVDFIPNHIAQNNIVFAKYQYVIRSEFLRGLFKKDIKHSSEAIISEANAIGISLGDEQYHVIQLRFDRISAMKASCDTHQWDILKLSAYYLVANCLNSFSCFFDDEECLVAILQTFDIKKAIQICRHLQSELMKSLQLSVSVGISGVYSLPFIAKGYLESNQALKYRLISNEAMIMTYRDTKAFQKSLIDSYLYRLSALFELQDAMTIINRLEEWNEDIKKSGLNAEALESLEKELKVVLLALLRQDVTKNGVQHRIYYAEQLEQIEAGDSFSEKMLPVIQILNDLIRQEERSEIPFDEQAIRYLQDHYHLELPLKEIAKHVHLNPAYFGVIFKKKTGKSVIEFLTEIRLNAAKELLMQPELKVHQIAKMIGLKNAAYFTSQFTKLTGISPMKYRSMKLK